MLVTEDRSTIITADEGNESLLVLWNSRTGSPIKSIPQAHAHGITAMDLSPGGEWLATVSAPAPGTGEQEVRGCPKCTRSLCELRSWTCPWCMQPGCLDCVCIEPESGYLTLKRPQAPACAPECGPCGCLQAQPFLRLPPSPAVPEITSMPSCIWEAHAFHSRDCLLEAIAPALHSA